MGRSRLAVLSLAAVLAVALSAVPTGHARTAVICPLSTAATGTCCGPPILEPTGQIPCCPSAATPCRSPLTLTSSPEPSGSGRQVTLTGTTRAEGDEVLLWERPPGRQTFQRVASTIAAPAGSYAFFIWPKTNVSLYVTSVGRQSRTVAQRVRAAVVLRASSRRSGTLVRVALAGIVRPNHAGERVALQRRLGGHWRTVSSSPLRAAAGGGAAFDRVLILRRGRNRASFRTLLYGDARNVTSVSRPVVVRDVA